MSRTAFGLMVGTLSKSLGAVTDFLTPFSKYGLAGIVTGVIAFLCMRYQDATTAYQTAQLEMQLKAQEQAHEETQSQHTAEVAARQAESRRASDDRRLIQLGLDRLETRMDRVSESLTAQALENRSILDEIRNTRREVKKVQASMPPELKKE